MFNSCCLLALSAQDQVASCQADWIGEQWWTWSLNFRSLALQGGCTSDVHVPCSVVLESEPPNAHSLAIRAILVSYLRWWSSGSKHHDQKTKKVFPCSQRCVFFFFQVRCCYGLPTVLLPRSLLPWDVQDACWGSIELAQRGEPKSVGLLRGWPGWPSAALPLPTATHQCHTRNGKGL